MEIGRRTLFRTCEITWARKRFAAQGHLEKGWLYFDQSLFFSDGLAQKGHHERKLSQPIAAKRFSSRRLVCPYGLRNQAISLLEGI
jgi:hypothetical protein